MIVLHRLLAHPSPALHTIHREAVKARMLSIRVHVSTALAYGDDDAL